MIGFFAAFEAFFFRYFNFFGRATRAEFWFVMPVLWLSIIALFILDTMTVWDRLLERKPSSFNPLSYSWFILFIVTLIPRFSLTARRLNDAGRSPRWMLLPYGALLGTFSTTLGIATAVPALQPYVAGLALSISILGSKLLDGTGDTMWQGLYLFAATAQHVNWIEAVADLWNAIPSPGYSEVSHRLGAGMANDPAGAAGAMAYLSFMIFSPIVSMLAYLWFMAQPSQNYDNGFGAPRNSSRPTPPKGGGGDNPFAGYAAIMARTPEQERAMAIRRQTEVKALYRERILKK